MEITIGVQHVARELVLETDRTAEELAADVAAALSSGGPLTLTDTRGRTVLVPAGALGYLEMGGEEVRKVGFHNI